MKALTLLTLLGACNAFMSSSGSSSWGDSSDGMMRPPSGGMMRAPSSGASGGMMNPSSGRIWGGNRPSGGMLPGGGGRPMPGDDYPSGSYGGGVGSFPDEQHSQPAAPYMGPGGYGYPPQNGYSPGMGPGGAGRPPPPYHHPPEGQQPPSMVKGANKGVTATQLEMTLGSTTNSLNELGSFNVWLLEKRMPDGAGNFKNTAVGTQVPQTPTGEMTQQKNRGFVGLSVKKVFPQFATCYPNATAADIATYVAQNNDQVMGEVSNNDPDYTGIAIMKAGQGGGVVTIIQPGNFYFIAEKDTQFGAVTNIRAIGFVDSDDMEFLENVRKYLCEDYETVYGTLSSSSNGHRRRKRGEDGYGFTSCTVK